MHLPWGLSAWAVAALALVGASVVAEEPAPRSEASTPAQVAEQVLALAAGDEQGLRAVAAADHPDPWLVVDELLARGARAAAERLARADPRKALAALPSYVAAWKALPGDSERRAALDSALAAVSAGQAEAAVRALAAFERDGARDVLAVRVEQCRATALHAMRRAREAKEAQLRAAEVAEGLGWLLGAGRALNAVGIWALSRSDARAALEAWRRSLAFAQAAEHRMGVVATRGNMGEAYALLGETALALEAYGEGLAEFESMGLRYEAAIMRNNLAVLRKEAGDLVPALEQYRRVFLEMRATGQRLLAAVALGNMGLVHRELGEPVLALEELESALAEHRALSDQEGVARSLGNLGLVQIDLGDPQRALELYAASLAEYEALGDRAQVARTMILVGSAHLLEARRAGDDDEAREAAYREASRWYERARDARTAASLPPDPESLLGLGTIWVEQGAPERALPLFEQVLELARSRGGRWMVARAFSEISSCCAALGRLPRAIETGESALEGFEQVGARLDVVRMLANLAHMHARGGATAKALELARRAALEHARFAGGLAEVEGSRAREGLSFIYDVGAEIAFDAGDHEQLAFFLEMGRAGALLEGLRARPLLEASLVPQALVDQQTAARIEEASALQAVARAEGRDVLKAAKERLETARRRHADSVGRIQRQSKAAAALLYPESATLARLRAMLEPGDALVLYGLSARGALALVVTRAGTRTVALGSMDAIVAAVEQLGLEDASSPADAPLARLSELVVRPLALPPEVVRVLVSPAGALFLAPFGALFPALQVVHVPSGTTYEQLRALPGSRGAGVLALGDPDYVTRPHGRALATFGGGRRLGPLPATREEAKAVGDVLLLGQDATEAGLRAALASRSGWRAIHLACHGLIRPDQPMLSSLALAPEGEDDGFLTALEVLCSRVPADLAVLSACETGRGRVVRGEGVVGLTRAFLFAGAPRVLCSLWRVDDEATRALMTRFHSLWNPRTGAPAMPAAQALREAQVFVRTQERWRHPCYWAAWCLWGLGD